MKYFIICMLLLSAISGFANNENSTMNIVCKCEFEMGTPGDPESYSDENVVVFFNAVEGGYYEATEEEINIVVGYMCYQKVIAGDRRRVLNTNSILCK